MSITSGSLSIKITFRAPNNNNPKPIIPGPQPASAILFPATSPFIAIFQTHSAAILLGVGYCSKVREGFSKLFNLLRITSRSRLDRIMQRIALEFLLNLQQHRKGLLKLLPNL